MLFATFILSLLVVFFAVFRNNEIGRRAVTLVCMCALLYGFDLGAKNLTLGGHEILVSETAVEMGGRGDWLIPMFNNQPRILKPPLQYWLVGAVSGVLGGVNELTSRLPSAFFGLGLVLMTYFFGRRFFDDGVAFFAGALQSGNLFMIRFSREGTADIGNTFFIFAAFLCAWFILEGRAHKRLWQLGLWFLLALDMLIKGPFGVFTTLVTIPVYALCFKRGRDLKDIFSGWGILLFVALSVPWYIYLGFNLAGTWRVWYGETFLRVAGGKLAKSPWYIYFPTLFELLGQWGLILPFALARVFRREYAQKRKILGFFFLWFMVEFLLVSLSSTKRGRYLIWGLTPMAYLMALELIELGKKFAARGKTAAFASIIGSIVAVVGAIAGLYLNAEFKWLPGYQAWFIPAMGLGLALFCGLLYKGRPKDAMTLFFAAEVFFFMAGVRLVYPRFNKDIPVVEFARDIPRHVSEKGKIFIIDRMNNAMIFYSGRFMRPVKSVEEARLRGGDDSTLYIISRNYSDFWKHNTQLKLIGHTSSYNYRREPVAPQKEYGLFRIDARGAGKGDPGGR